SPARFEHVQIDLRGVVHHVRVVLAGENVAGAAHVGGQLIDLVEAAVDGLPADIPVAEVADDEIVGFRLGEARVLQIHTADPETLPAQPSHNVGADEAAGSQNKGSLHSRSPFFPCLDLARPASIPSASRSRARQHPSGSPTSTRSYGA